MTKGCSGLTMAVRSAPRLRETRLAMPVPSAPISPVHEGHVPQLVQPIAYASSVQELAEAIGRAVNSGLFFEMFSIGMMSENSDLAAPQTVPVMTNADSGWLKKYAEEGYLDIDPRIRHARHSNLPRVWDPDTYKTGRPAQMFEEARVFGIRTGIVVPLGHSNRSAAMMAFSTSENLTAKQVIGSPHILPKALLIAKYAHNALEKWQKEMIDDPATHSLNPSGLTQKQRLILTLLCRGWTADQIAPELHVALSTLRAQIIKIRTKLGATNQHHLTAIAVQRGLVD